MVDVESPDDVIGIVRERVAATAWPSLVGLGIGAFVAGILLTTGLAFVGTWPSVDGLQSIGFAFYSAHTVPVVVAGGGTFDFLGRLTDPDVPIAAYYSVPILVLLVTGAVARWREPGPTAIDPVQIGLDSLGIAAGYVVTALLGTVLFTSGIVGIAAVSLPLGRTALFAALYAVAFGTIGAAVVTGASVLVDGTR